MASLLGLRKLKTKEEGLQAFKKAGFLLLDATYTPVDGMKEGRARNKALLADLPNLRGYLKAADPKKKAPVLLLKANVCRILTKPLRDEGYQVLNGEDVIPFPSTGNQGKFRERIRAVLAPHGLVPDGLPPSPHSGGMRESVETKSPSMGDLGGGAGFQQQLAGMTDKELLGWLLLKVGHATRARLSSALWHTGNMASLKPGQIVEVMLEGDWHPAVFLHQDRLYKVWRVEDHPFMTLQVDGNLIRTVKSRVRAKVTGEGADAYVDLEEAVRIQRSLAR